MGAAAGLVLLLRGLVSPPLWLQVGVWVAGHVDQRVPRLAARARQVLLLHDAWGGQKVRGEGERTWGLGTRLHGHLSCPTL